MGAPHIETYVILDSHYGIEDYEDGYPDKDHFFPGKYRDSERKRFTVWRNGCGIGQADTIGMARSIILDSARTRTKDMVEGAVRTITLFGSAYEKLVQSGLDEFKE